MLKTLQQARGWLSRKRWHQTTAFRGQMFKWSDYSESVRIVWTPGAGNHSGWRVEVIRDDVRLQLGNGFVDWRGALLLADLYMADGTVIPVSAPGGKSQAEWVSDELPKHDWQVIDPNTLTPKCPLKATS